MRTYSNSLTFTAFLCAAATLSACAAETQEKSPKPADTTVETPKPSINAEKISDGFYRLTGPGGNIGISIGEDGVFVIDDKFDRFGDDIILQINALTDHPIRYVVNTHYHGDHTGANGKMKSAGATIVAHDNVRSRMGQTFENKLWGRTVDATEPQQWPTVTFSETATYHMNGQTIRLIHVPSAHTDGDAIIYFAEANILHMGDNFFKGMFPYVDIDGGGSLQGMIDAQTMAIEMTDSETKIIPGHGNMSMKSELIQSRDRLIEISARVEKSISEGHDLDAILEKNILSDMSEFASFIDEEKMVRIAHRSLTKG